MPTNMFTPNTRTSRLTVAIAAVALVVALLTSCVPASAPWTSDVPAGSLDSAYLASDGTTLTVRGWASDRNSSAPLAVLVWVDGSLLAGAVIADQSRPDVQARTGRGANSGFAATKTTKWDASGSEVCVSVLNVGPGKDALLGCREVWRGAPQTPRVTTPTTTAKPTTTTTVKPTTTTTAKPTTTTTAVPTHCDAPAETEVDWHDCDKHGIDLSSETLYGANFSGTNLSGADLSDTNLYGANLSGANLTGANLSGAWMPYTDLSDAITSGTNITGAQWSFTVCPDGTNTGESGTCVGHGF